jgi:hypothetical protein
MRISENVRCDNFPCTDVKHNRYTLPSIDIIPENVVLILISEAVPNNPHDDYYAGNQPSFEITTLQSFNQAGVKASTLRELLSMGVYFTTAVKCSKTGYGIRAATIKECSQLLEKELSQFPNVQAYLLMGDVAIKGINHIAKRETASRAIPAGSTYKIRGGEYYFRGKRAFPSYLQVGPSFGIEKSKQRMIVEDIAAAAKIALG